MSILRRAMAAGTRPPMASLRGANHKLRQKQLEQDEARISRNAQFYGAALHATKPFTVLTPSSPAAPQTRLNLSQRPTPAASYNSTSKNHHLFKVKAIKTTTPTKTPKICNHPITPFKIKLLISSCTCALSFACGKGVSGMGRWRILQRGPQPSSTLKR
jgi:hypothetical protein